MRHIGFLLFVFPVLILSACAAEETPPTAATDSSPAVSAEALSGTWTGDWGPAENQRNPVTLQLNWDGTTLSGTVNPGPNAVPFKTVSFAPETAMVKMEASAAGSGGKEVHYVVEGKLDGDTLTGTWTQDDKTGDFKLKKS